VVTPKMGAPLPFGLGKMARFGHDFSPLWPSPLVGYAGTNGREPGVRSRRDGIRKRRHMMEHAVRSGHAVRVDELYASECEAEDAADEFGLIAGLRFAVPIGLAI